MDVFFIFDYAVPIVPPVLVAVAVWADLRTRRGIGIALASTLLIAAGVWLAVAFIDIGSTPSVGGITSIATVVLDRSAANCVLTVVAGAVIEAIIFRERGWLIGLIASVAAPGLLLEITNVLDFGDRGLGGVGTLAFVALILFPTLAALLFGLDGALRTRRRAA